MKTLILNGLTYALTLMVTVSNVLLVGTLLYTMFIISLIPIEFTSIMIFLVWIYNSILTGLVSYKLFKKIERRIAND